MLYKLKNFENILRILIAFILIDYINYSYVFMDFKIPVFIIIIGYVIFKFKFNSKVIANVILLFLTPLLAVMTTFPYLIFVPIALFMIVVVSLILIMNYVKRKNTSLCLVITLIIIAQFFTAYSFGELYGDELYKYYLWILTYLLFFTIQDKNLEECLNIKGILSIAVTFAMFYFINNEELEEKISSLNISGIIFDLYDFLKILLNIFIFYLIKNKKNVHIEELKND